MKSIFLISSLLLLAGVVESVAQDVNLQYKKELLTVDEKNCLKLRDDRLRGNTIYFYDLESNEEVLFIRFFYASGDIPAYWKVLFSKSNKSLEMSTSSDQKRIIQLLVREKILTDGCKIDEEKIDGFITRYNENITNEK